MIRIALFDDIPLQLTMVDDIVERYSRDRKLGAEIRLFGSGEELLDYVSQHDFFDVYILDMILPGAIGIEVGRKLRQMGDVKGKIIYLTATKEYAVESYSVDAFFYLLKPISRDAIYKVLDKAIVEIKPEREFDADEHKIEIRTKTGKKLVDVREITYIDIVNRGLCYHMKNMMVYEGVMLRKPFVEAVSELSAIDEYELAGTHLLVNISNVVKLDKTSVSFCNGEEIYPSKNAINCLYRKMKER